jgi:hypothetical protein
MATKETNHDAMNDQKWLGEIERITDQIKSNSEYYMARLPEHIFTNVFLPLFCGDEDRIYKDATLDTWIAMAGGPYHDVLVVDSADRVLFTVPALFDNSVVNPIRPDGPSIMHVIETAKQYSNVHPSQGFNYLTRELTRRAIVMKVPTSLISKLDTWNEIFARYNRPPIMVVTENAQNKETGDSDPIVGFDPL